MYILLEYFCKWGCTLLHLFGACYLYHRLIPAVAFEDY